MAHGVECVVAVPALHHSETHQDGNSADVRDQQIEKSGSSHFGQVMIGGDQKV